MESRNERSIESAETKAVAPVRKKIYVRCEPQVAFRTFTEGMDSWWPRDYHVGDSPLTAVHVEGRPGGRVYSDQEDGSQCQWGTVLVWEPPTRFVMAWQIRPDWRPEADLEKCSELELVFTSEGHNQTLVEFEHRFFERHEGAFRELRDMVDSEGGWDKLLRLFADKAESALNEFVSKEKQ